MKNIKIFLVSLITSFVFIGCATIPQEHLTKTKKIGIISNLYPVQYYSYLDTGLIKMTNVFNTGINFNPRSYSIKEVTKILKSKGYTVINLQNKWEAYVRGKHPRDYFRKDFLKREKIPVDTLIYIDNSALFGPDELKSGMRVDFEEPLWGYVHNLKTKSSIVISAFDPQTRKTLAIQPNFKDRQKVISVDLKPVFKNKSIKKRHVNISHLITTEQKNTVEKALIEDLKFLLNKSLRKMKLF